MLIDSLVCCSVCVLGISCSTEISLLSGDVNFNTDLLRSFICLYIASETSNNFSSLVVLGAISFIVSIKFSI